MHIGLFLSRIIASNRAESLFNCGQYCIAERSCVGFNFNDRSNNDEDSRHNCELTDELRQDPGIEVKRDSTWKYYQSIFQVSIFLARL